MMCCAGPLWGVIGYFLGRWCLFAWKPLDYPDSPRWMCNPSCDRTRRWVCMALSGLLLLWWVPVIWALIFMLQQSPAIVYMCANVTLVVYGTMRWLGLDPSPRALTTASPGWLPVHGRWTPGLLVAIGLLGLAWQFAGSRH